MVGLLKENSSLGHSSTVTYRQTHVQQSDPGGERCFICLSISLFPVMHLIPQIECI